MATKTSEDPRRDDQTPDAQKAADAPMESDDLRRWKLALEQPEAAKKLTKEFSDSRNAKQQAGEASAL
ncbi:hypothetical protein M3Y99_01563500 [Aphelenchoides fujianensis]|nr:hypothetical protein M3Y99_01563500 [Aphelenchoides fujianensis]